MIIIFLLIFLFCGCEKRIHIRNGKLAGIKTIEDLNHAAVFQFAIMSDNKGDSGKNSRIFANMEKWLKESDTKFIIGMGDHVKIGWDNSFLQLIKNDVWWNTNFYPNIADGENEFFGTSQGDWAAGGKLLDYLKLSHYAKVEIRDNKAEYYLRRKIGEFTFHLIQLHYPDEPDTDSLAFRSDSKQFMTDKLRSIQKSDHDIVIVGAHSRTGFWFDMLSKEQQDVVLQKCDLVLSATTHFFERQQIDGYDREGPLFINTGSITYPTKYSPYGFVQIHVLKYPPMLVVQYIDASQEKAEIQNEHYAFIKKVNGEIYKTDFRPIRPQEDFQRTITFLPKEINRQDMNLLITKLYLHHTGADISLQQVEQGLPQGEIQYHQLWNIFPYNNEIVALTLDKNWLQSNFEINVAAFQKDSLITATSYFHAVRICQYLSLSERKMIRSDIKEIPALEKFLQERNELISPSSSSIVRGISYVNVYVDDFQRNFDFYHKILDLSIESQTDDKFCTFQLSENILLNLIGGKQKFQLNEKQSHVSFVFSVSSVNELFERLQKENTVLLHDKPQNRGDGRYWFMFRDPADNILEIVGGL
jgi:predicted enzyme related to lactoylglutathione lyase